MNHWVLAYAFLAVCALALLFGGALQKKAEPLKWSSADQQAMGWCFLCFVLFAFIAICNWRD